MTTSPTPEEEEETTAPSIEASAWRVGSAGLLITSVVERHVAELAEFEPNTIFFYADLGESTELKNTQETMEKVFRALASVGLSEGQIIGAVSSMQSDGILFRERAI